MEVKKLTKEETLEMENLNLKVQNVKSQAQNTILDLQTKFDKVLDKIFEKNKITDRAGWNINLEKGQIEKKPKEVKKK